MKKFKLHIVREGRAATEDSRAVESDEKDIQVMSLTCCEAMVVAHRQHPDYAVTSCEELVPNEPEAKPKRVHLDKASFKSEVEWTSAQMDMDIMDYDAGMKLAEKRGWKIAKEDE